MQFFRLCSVKRTVPGNPYHMRTYRLFCIIIQYIANVTISLNHTHVYMSRLWTPYKSFWMVLRLNTQQGRSQQFRNGPVVYAGPWRVI